MNWFKKLFSQEFPTIRFPTIMIKDSGWCMMFGEWINVVNHNNKLYIDGIFIKKLKRNERL